MSKIKREILGQTIEIELTELEEINIYEEVRLRYEAETFGEFLENEGYFGVPEAMVKAMAKEVADLAYESDMGDGLEYPRGEVLEKHRKMLEYFRDREEGD